MNKQNSYRSCFLLVFLLLAGMEKLCAQSYFDESKLLNPKKNGPDIKAKFKEELVYEYKVTAGKHAVFLKNGLRSSDFAKPELWLNIRDTVYPYQVDIVYSRYPVRNGAYSEIYPLLCNRLIHLFNLDASLNDPDFTWRTILQTHIDNDEQVNSLFHGIVIWYRTPAEEAALKASTDSLPVSSTLVQTETNTQGGIKETQVAIDAMMQSSLINDSIKLVIKDKPLDVKKQILQKHLMVVANNNSTLKLTERTPLEMFQYKRQVAEFLKNNQIQDSVVWKVMDRHPEWVDALVVNDWTGSMYGYGAQVVQWHLVNYKTSGIRFVTLFNDGDNKTNASKIIGETGGIYSVEASDINTILNLFNLVRINGSGGDRQENDVEAILESVKRFPDHKEIILIADNYACIRDIELATKINKPVRVIVCGYNKDFGVNSDLAYLAKVTGGGLYSLSQDIENLKMEVNSIGEIKEFKDRRFVISMLNCKPKPIYDIHYARETFITYTNYDTALLNKEKVRQLDLSEQEIQKVPTGIFKMENMLSLDLRKNHIKQIPGAVKKLENLKELNLSSNELLTLPKTFAKLMYLEDLNLSSNHILNLNEFYPNWHYLKKLDISNNQIANIEGFNALKNLMYANLSNNNITELDPGFSLLKRLISLDLSNNKLLYLPRNFSGLIKLEELNLENNQLGSLPPYLYRLRKLKTLNLSGNPLGEKEKQRIRNELPNVEITF